MSIDDEVAGTGEGASNVYDVVDDRHPCTKQLGTAELDSDVGNYERTVSEVEVENLRCSWRLAGDQNDHCRIELTHRLGQQFPARARADHLGRTHSVKAIAPNIVASSGTRKGLRRRPPTRGIGH